MTLPRQLFEAMMRSMAAIDKVFLIFIIGLVSTNAIESLNSVIHKAINKTQGIANR